MGEGTDQPEGQGDQIGEGRRDQRDQDHGPSAEQHLVQDVTAYEVGAEPVAAAEGEGGCAGRGFAHEERPEDGEAERHSGNGRAGPVPPEPLHAATPDRGAK